MCVKWVTGSDTKSETNSVQRKLLWSVSIFALHPELDHTLLRCGSVSGYHDDTLCRGGGKKVLVILNVRTPNGREVKMKGGAGHLKCLWCRGRVLQRWSPEGVPTPPWARAEQRGGRWGWRRVEWELGSEEWTSEETGKNIKASQLFIFLFLPDLLYCVL